jgi:galactose mutarotase-like enzyme
VNLHEKGRTRPIEIWKIFSDVARADVFSIGGALHNLTFDLPSGKSYSPLAEAPWQSDYLLNAEASHRPKHLELLGGEWPCVPFGTTSLDPAHHGFGTDNPWTVDASSNNHIELSITYPEDHAIKRLQRKITLPMGETHVQIELNIVSRKTVFMPIGLHPIFRPPDQPNEWLLIPGQHDYATAAPPNAGRIESALKPGVTLPSLERVPLSGGGTTNVLRSPEQLKDALIQLWNCAGSFDLLNHAQGVSTRVHWDNTVFPHCLIWICNSTNLLAADGQKFQGIGIEPVNSFFDINDASGPPDGWPDGKKTTTGIQLIADEPWSTRYQIACQTMKRAPSG